MDAGEQRLSASTQQSKLRLWTFFIATLAVFFSHLQLAGADETQPPLQASTKAETFGAWTIRCAAAEANSVDPSCEAVLLVLNRGAELAELAIGQGVDGQGIIIAGRTPLGVLISEPMRLAADSDSDPIKISYVTCLSNGCLAQTTVELAALTNLLSGEAASLSFTERSGRVLKIGIAITGLKDALARLGIA